ncbi:MULTISPECIES: hypothetical protein [Pseudomonas]|nr:MULTISPECIES: hypothetical protein [Pseudomonas]WKL52777.1 hypothetical protein Q1W70_25735 [Pseudomonas kielensis]
MTSPIDRPDENVLALPALALNGFADWRRLAKLWHETSSSPAIP